MVQAVQARRAMRAWRFEVRLIEQGGLWSGEAVRTFKAQPFHSVWRGTAAGFRRYQAEMERNGFELQRVRVVRGSAA